MPINPIKAIDAIPEAQGDPKLAEINEGHQPRFPPTRLVLRIWKAYAAVSSWPIGGACWK
jgi:hypothetical protein